MISVQGTLQRLLVAQTRHPVLFLCLGWCLAALSILYTVRNLEFQTGQMDLISPDVRLKQITEQMRGFDELDAFIVVIENRSEDRSLQFLHRLVPLLEADGDHYKQVFHRVDPESFRPWALLYLDMDDLSALHEKIREHHSFIHNLAGSPDLVHFFRAVNHEMTSAMVGELFTGFLREPSQDEKREALDLSFLIRTLEGMMEWMDGDGSVASPWESFLIQRQGSSPSEEGYFWTEDMHYLLIFITPRKKEGFTDALHALSALRGKIAGLRMDFPDIEAGVTGMEALNQDEMGAAFRDMSVATLISLLGLAALLIIFWRSFRLPLIEMIELSVALSCTFGLTTLFVGHLNILSITFAPLLLGLGIDYGIHWLARYQEEEQRNGASKEEAVEAAMLKVGPGILLAGMTSALSFFALVLTGFKGLVELGMITSMGMVMTTMTTLCLLPVLTLLFGGSGRPQSSFISGTGTRLRFSTGTAFAILVPGSAALALSLWGTAGVSFDLNMLNLQSREAESVVWEKKLIEGSGMSSMAGAILVNSLEEVRERTDVLQTLPTVSEVQSILSFLPKDQEAKIRLLREMAPLIAGIEPLSMPLPSVDLAELDEALGRIRFKVLEDGRSDLGASKPLEHQMFQARELIDSVRQRLRTDPSAAAGKLKEFETALVADLGNMLDLLSMSVHATPMKTSDLPKTLLQRFGDEDGRYLIRVLPAVDIWDTDLLGGFVEELVSVEPDTAGDPVTWYFFTKAFRDACIKAAIYAIVFILVVLLLTFRIILTALLVTIPLVVGTVWTVGLMDLFDIDFNLANTIFLPLVVGAGIEYGIIIMRRRLEEGDVKAAIALPGSTIKGIVLSGLTTTVGFGSLMISGHQGIYSLGLLATVGSLSILAAAVLFLPAVLQVFRREDG